MKNGKQAISPMINITETEEDLKRTKELRILTTSARHHSHHNATENYYDDHQDDFHHNNNDEDSFFESSSVRTGISLNSARKGNGGKALQFSESTAHGDNDKNHNNSLRKLKRGFTSRFTMEELSLTKSRGGTGSARSSIINLSKVTPLHTSGNGMKGGNISDMHLDSDEHIKKLKFDFDNRSWFQRYIDLFCSVNLKIKQQQKHTSSKNNTSSVDNNNNNCKTNNNNNNNSSSNNTNINVNENENDEIITYTTKDKFFLEKRIWHRCKILSKYFLEEWLFKISFKFEDVLLIMVFFIIYEEAIRILLPEYEPEIYYFFLVSFFCFVIEILFSLMGNSQVHWDSRKPFVWKWDCRYKVLPTNPITNKIKISGYFHSFYFYIDLICLFSMIPQVKFISKDTWFEDNMQITAEILESDLEQYYLLKIFYCVRLCRLIKFYKIYEKKLKEWLLLRHLEELELKSFILNDKDESCINEIVDLELKIERVHQSRVGNELSSQTTKRVIYALFLLLLLISYLSMPSSTNQISFTVDILQKINKEEPSLLGDTVDFYKNWYDTTFMYLKMTPTTEYNFVKDVSHINKNALLEYKMSEVDTSSGIEYTVEMGIDNTLAIREAAIMDMIILQSVLLSMVIIAQFFFDQGTRKLVLEPIDDMVSIIDRIAMDPLAEINMKTATNNRTKSYETRILITSIKKITALLRVGFGVAGANIIKKNIDTQNMGGVVDPIIPGKKIQALLGFCDIHHFDYITEKLTGEIMVFVNTVAQIVHDQVHYWKGNCNKNLGNCFLLVWRLGDAEEIAEFISKQMGISFSDTTIKRTARSPKAGGNKTPKQRLLGVTQELTTIDRIPGADALADQALISFLKIVKDISEDTSIKGYNNHPKLIDDDDDEHKGFKVSMGFGLHAGWAIEGAVGSIKKVDATYLSPHVNMAARMETASKQYGVSVLITKPFYQVLSENAQKVCRKLDVITVRGSAVPMPIYTHDCYTGNGFSRKAYKAYEYYPEMWTRDTDLLLLRRLISKEFREIFAKGVEEYIKGDWSHAKINLEKCNELLKNTGGDGPSKTLLSFMGNRNFIAPADWEGYRGLMSK